MGMDKLTGEADIVQFLEQTEVDASVTRPLQVFAVKGSATIVVTGADMNGDELAEFTLDADSKFHALLELIREHIPKPALGAWTIIAPGGDVLDETHADSEVKKVF